MPDDVKLENNNVSPIEQHVDHNNESDVSSRASSVVCDDYVIHEQMIYPEVQQTNVVESNTADMGNTNVIPYEHYVKHNVESVVPNDESSVDHDLCELDEYTANVADDTLTTRIKILKDQVTIYQQRAKFELTEREQKMDWQMCAYITERNLKEEALRKEIKSLQNQIDQTVKQK